MLTIADYSWVKQLEAEHTVPLRRHSQFTHYTDKRLGFIYNDPGYVLIANQEENIVPVTEV